MVDLRNSGLLRGGFGVGKSGWLAGDDAGVRLTVILLFILENSPSLWVGASSVSFGPLDLILGLIEWTRPISDCMSSIVTLGTKFGLDAPLVFYYRVVPGAVPTNWLICFTSKLRVAEGPAVEALHRRGIKGPSWASFVSEIEEIGANGTPDRADQKRRVSPAFICPFGDPMHFGHVLFRQFFLQVLTAHVDYVAAIDHAPYAVLNWVLDDLDLGPVIQFGNEL